MIQLQNEFYPGVLYKIFLQGINSVFTFHIFSYSLNIVNIKKNVRSVEFELVASLLARR